MAAAASAATTMFCFVVLLAFCFFASMALIRGYYGPVELVAGAGCSLLVRPSSFLVQDITVRMGKEGGGGSDENGVVLYGLASAPLRLDVLAEWSEARRVVVPAHSHGRWVYFLNKGSPIEVNYSAKPETELISPLIAQGSDETINKTVNSSAEYYIRVQNRKDHDTTVQLDFRIRVVLYDTASADYACSPGKTSVCKYRLPILGQNVAILSSGFRQRLNSDEEQHVTVVLSYEPRWIMFVVGSAVLSISLLLMYEILSVLFGPCNIVGSSRAGGAAEQRASPSLMTTTAKEEEAASLGSSYDSISGDDDDVEAGAGAEDEGRRLCVVCCDARRDCFFLPCGHSATCHTCGTRILEGDDGSCPVCRRKLKKVRRIFTV